MAFEFTETAPVTRAGGSGPGRKESPFEAPVKSIAGVMVEAEVKGKKVSRPKTLQFVADHAPDAKEIKTIRGQLQNMGKRCEPEVTVHVDTVPETRDVKGKQVPTGKTIVRFWTSKKIHRARKPKTSPTA